MLAVAIGEPLNPSGSTILREMREEREIERGREGEKRSKGKATGSSN